MSMHPLILKVNLSESQIKRRQARVITKKKLARIDLPMLCGHSDMGLTWHHVTKSLVPMFCAIFSAIVFMQIGFAGEGATTSAQPTPAEARVPAPGFSEKKRVELSSQIEPRSLSELEGSPIQRMLLPKNWKMADYEEPDFGLGWQKFVVSFQAPKGEPLEEFFIREVYNPQHDALYKFCARGPRILFQSSWQNAPTWTLKDKRFQDAQRELASISRSFRNQSNQFSNPKNPKKLFDVVEVKKVGGKLILAMSGVCLDEKNQPYGYVTDMLVPTYNGSYWNFFVGVSARSKKDFE